MKKCLCLFLTVLICASILCSCDGSASSDNTDFYGDNSGDNIVITEERAKQIAASHLYDWIQYVSGLFPSFGWAPSETRFSVGSVERSGNSYYVNGRYVTYDKYGNYNKSYSFTVVVNSEGRADLIDAGDDTLNKWVGGYY